MKNLIPETKRSYFKLVFHIMIFSILISLLLVTMNNHVESDKRKELFIKGLNRGRKKCQ